MKKNIFWAILCILVTAPLVSAQTISVSPSEIYQGDPVLITVATTSPGIKSAIVGSSSIYFFHHGGSDLPIEAALYGVALDQKIGSIPVKVIFKDGSQATTSFMVDARPRPQEFLAVPSQIGGNSDDNQARIVSILGTENDELAKIFSNTHLPFWTDTGTGSFIFPVMASTGTQPVVTDPYGYTRDSGSATITHKGVDFKAPPGTPVYAIANGVVRVAKPYVVYGNTIIVDHGLGLLSMYMHLSHSTISPGEAVKQGQLLGYSGETGYSEGPHLHLTVRIGGVSIDPMKFFALFGLK